MFGQNGEENIPHREWLIVFDEVLHEVKDQLRKQGRGDEFFGSKVGISASLWSHGANLYA